MIQRSRRVNNLVRTTILALGAGLVLLGSASCRRNPPQQDKATAASATPMASTEPLTAASTEVLEGHAGGTPATAATTITKAPATAGDRNKTKGPKRSTARFTLDGPELPIAMGGAATVFS